MAAVVDLDREGAVGICRIASPATRNALSPALMESIAAGLEALDGDDSIRCIVLSGADDVFATGADLSSLGAGGDASPDLAAASFWERLGAIEKPVIAATSGWALGTGFELALAEAGASVAVSDIHLAAAQDAAAELAGAIAIQLDVTSAGSADPPPHGCRRG